jgi:hypothetical protein
LKISVQEDGFNINSVSVLASGGYESEKSAEGAEFHDGGGRVGIVDAGTLTKALGHQTGFEAIDKAIGNILDFENPFLPTA